jgi:hypothetical protein
MIVMENSEWFMANKGKIGLVVGLALGLIIGFPLGDSGKTVEKKVVDNSKLVTADELCSSIYGAEYGHGSGITDLSCAKDGKWYDLSVRELSKAVNSSYTLGEN